MKGSIDPQNLSEFRVKVLLESGKLRELPLNKGFYPLSIYFYPNSQLTELTKQLANNLQNEQKDSPLESPLVVVPNPNLIPWLRLTLPKYANRFISANIQFTFLEKAILQKIGDASGMPSWDSKLSVNANEELHQKIFGYLYENQISLIQAFPMVKAYLEKVSGIYFLSDVFLKYFKDYELNRSGWIYEWAKEAGFDMGKALQLTPIPKELESDPYYLLQKQVYQNLFLKDNAPLTFLYRLNLSRMDKISGSIHLFCLSNLSGSFIQYFKEMADKSSTFQIHIYQFHSGIVIKNEKKTNELNLYKFAKPQNYLASTFGSFGKLNSERLKSPKTKLDQLKLLTNGVAIETELDFGNSQELGNHDTSLQIWNAPSTYREVETIAYDILERIQKSDCKLSFLDFAILVPNLGEYRSSIEWIFDGGVYIAPIQNKPPERKQIPYSLTDISSAESSDIFKVLTTLFRAFQNQRFERSDLNQIFTNPFVTGKFDTESHEELLHVLDAIGVKFDEAGYHNPYTMSYGVERSILSILMEKESAWKTFEEVIPEIGSQSLILRFCDIWFRIQTLEQIIRKITTQKENRYEEFFSAFKNCFLFSDETRNEEELFNKWLSTIEPWLELNWKNEIEFLEALSFHTESVFGGIKLIKGNYLSSGVTVSLLQPMRPIPFKHIYILGLGEGKFPGSNDQSKLNLRRFDSYPWDLTKREIQESLLWETIQSAQDSITFSYVGKNTKEDKEFEPCSSLFEIMSAIEIPKAEEIPLHPYSTQYNRNKIPSYDYSRNIVFEKELQTIAEEIPKFTDPNSLPSLTNGIQKTVLTPKDLQKVFENPMNYRIQSGLGIYLSEDEEEEGSEEQFQLNHLENFIIKSKVFSEVFHSLTENQTWDLEALEDLVDRIIEKESKAANFTFGGYSILSKNKLLEELEAACEYLLNFIQGLRDRGESIVFHKTVTYGDTGIRGAKVIEPNFVFDKSSDLELASEWQYVIESNRTFYIFQLSKLEEHTKAYDEFSPYISRYFSKIAKHYIGACLLKLANYETKILVLPKKKPEESKSQKGGKKPKTAKTIVSFPKLTNENAEKYLNQLLHLAFADEVPYFPYLAFHNFFAGYQKEEDKEALRLKSEADIIDELKTFYEENLDFILENEDKVFKLSPHKNEYSKEIRFDLALPLYLPLVLDMEYI
ncbi:MAG: exodeoxyribonuclease V subunit gamma [Leptospira sp.]|nr:exodeoxyribonuclease V subunit gamma [Leptospira sp.]